MRVQKLKQVASFSLLNLLIILSAASIATASSSPNYQVNEYHFGSGGQVCNQGVTGYSSNYCATTSVGELTVGNTAGTAYQAQAGYNTGREPSLTFVVNAGSTNLGGLTSGTAKTATGTFNVKSYLSGGYVVINAGDPPTNGTHTMTALASPTASNTAVEQFGINLVANTAPASFGANAVQVPDNTFSFGTVASGYDTANVFKYVKGDTIASSSKSSGETDYTVSYLFNASPVTPGGTYTLDHVLVATATF